MNQIYFYYYTLLLFAYSGEYIAEVLVQVKIRHTLSGNNKLNQNTPITDLCYSIVTVERIGSYKLVNTKNIKVMNQTQPALLSQPHRER